MPIKPILHSYDASPFGNAMRRALSLKGIAYDYVTAPVICPKPDLSALTGGYERIPVLQIGADIYCDTDCITDVIEAQFSDPSLYPEPLGRAGKIIAQWSGTSWFMPAVGAALGVNPDALDDEFWEDRAKRFGMRRETFLPAVPHLQTQFHAGAHYVKDALADGRPFVGGDAPGHADLMMHMNIGFVGFAGIRPSDFGETVSSWFARIDAIGFGDSEDLTAQEAIAVAAKHEPVGGHSVAESSRFTDKQTVSVKTESADPAKVTGTLVGLGDNSIVVSRTDEDVGEAHVHFPRMGQILAIEQ